MAMDAGDFKRYITKVDSEGGSSLHDHLTNVLLKIAKEKPADALQEFEDISFNVKNKLAVPLYSKLKPEDDDQKVRNELIASLNKASNLVSPPVNPDDDDAGAEEPEEGQTIPDILDLAETLSWAGVNFGQAETYKLHLAIEKLVKDKGLLDNPEVLTDIKFWGKIHGLNGDYYIVEAKIPEAEMLGDAPEPETKAEAPGTGANECVYYVTTDLTGEWTRLPWVTPDMINLSKQMRRYFTGDLKATVFGFPRFPYGEAAYLRAQIARISSATSICPKGLFEAGEDEEANVLTKTEGYTFPSAEEVSLFENWVHHRGFLFNKTDRVVPFNDEEAEEPDDDLDDEKKNKKDDDEPELPIAILRQIDEDKSPTGGKVWSVRAAPSLTSPHAVVSLQNFHWPGAITVFKGQEFSNIYVGFGHKYSAQPYSPPAPPAPANEYDVDLVVEGKPAQEEQIDPVPVPKSENDAKVEEDDEEDQ